MILMLELITSNGMGFCSNSVPPSVGTELNWPESRGFDRKWMPCFLYSINEFGTDGGPAARALKPKFNLFTNHIASLIDMPVPHVEMKHVIAATIALKGLGGLLFIFSSSFGAYLLILYLAFITPIVNDFYNYDIESKEFVQNFIKFTQNLALFGSLLFYLGMKNTLPKRKPKKNVKSKTN